MDQGARQLIDVLSRALAEGQLAQAQGLLAALQLVGGEAKVAAEYLALAPALKPAFAKVLGHGVGVALRGLRGESLSATHTYLAQVVRADPGAATVFLAQLSSQPELQRLFGTEVSNAVHDTANDPTAQGPMKGLVLGADGSGRCGGWADGGAAGAAPGLAHGQRGCP